MVQMTGQIEVLTSEGAPTGSTAAALVPPASAWLLPVPALSSCPIATPLILWLLLSSPCLVKHPHRHDGNSEFKSRPQPWFQWTPDEAYYCQSCSHRGWKGFMYVRLLRQPWCSALGAEKRLRGGGGGSATKSRNLVRSLVEEKTNSSNVFSDFYMCANTFSLSPFLLPL